MAVAESMKGGCVEGRVGATIRLQCCVSHKSEGALAPATAIGSDVCMWTALPWLGFMRTANT